MESKMEAIVLYPSAAIGHLISMVELAKLVLTRQPSLSVHVITFTLPFSEAGSSAADYISRVSSALPSITFHRLPTVTLPPSVTASSNHHETLIFEVLRLNNPNLRRTLVSISEAFAVSSFITDFFCSCAFSVTSQLRIPSYIFYTSGASCLCSLLHFPFVHRTTSKSFKDIHTSLHIPGLPPSFRGPDMAKPMLDRHDQVYEFFLTCAAEVARSAGLIVNTFESLETRAIGALRDGLCVPDGPTPPIYCVGPLINRGDSDDGEKPDCLTWLDSQPSQSVVFLCFGSMGVFSEEQLNEIAIGLEKSGKRFLWVVKDPSSRRLGAPDLNSFLPDGFLERTKNRGLVVKSWAPQVAVLNHDSVGGFVTHCGWNSVLEAVCAGVPMVAWPLYAEQRLNRVVLVDEIQIAFPMTENEENGFVSSDEVEKRVRELMDSEKGDSVRRRVKDLQNEAKAAHTPSEGGSSLAALAEFVESWKRS